MAAEVGTPATMPQLQSVQKAMALPTVEAAVGQFGALYAKVKGAHSLLEWALSTAEASVSAAAVVAAPYVAAPLAAGDARLAAALEQLERRVPLVAEQPKVIVETTKQAVLTRITPHVNKVCAARATAEQRVKSLKELSWTKANVLLSTAYGQKAMQTVDTGAGYAMQLLDTYLPPVGPQEEPSSKSLKELSWTKANVLLSTAYGQKAMQTVDTGAGYAMQLLDTYLPPVGPQEEASTEIVAGSADPALHTVQTVGRLSAVAARRVWANLACRVNDLRGSGVELDVRRYLAALLAALHLANVTSQQHTDETQEKKDNTEPPAQAAPPVPSPPARTVESSPTTTHKVKSTPEGKKAKEGSESPQ